MADSVEANEGDTVVHSDGEEWVIDKRMWIILPEGSGLRKTGKMSVVSRNPVFRNLKLHTFEDKNG